MRLAKSVSVMAPLPEPGVKLQALLEVDGLPGLPATFIGGLEEGPTVLAVAGVHGGEYAAILTLSELAAGLEPPDVRGRLLMIQAVNPQGFQERRATVLPQDGRNINSLFYDHSYSGPAAAVAGVITRLQAEADFYLDLHAADLFEESAPLACYPATGNEAVTRASRQAALMVRAPALIRSSLAGAGITEAARRGLPSLLIKRGGAGGACRRAEVDLYKEDVLNVLKHLGVVRGRSLAPPNPPEEIEPLYLRSPRPGLWRPALRPGQRVRAGQELGQITDFFGRVLETFPARKDGLVLYGLQALSANTDDTLLVY